MFEISRRTRQLDRRSDSDMSRISVVSNAAPPPPRVSFAQKIIDMSSWENSKSLDASIFANFRRQLLLAVDPPDVAGWH